MALLVLGIIVFLGLFVILGFEDRRNLRRWGIRGSQIFSLLGIIIIGFGCFATVDATEVAVVTRFGQVQRVDYEPGLKFKNPLDEYTCYKKDLQEIRYDDELTSIEVYSKDSQVVHAKVTAQWTIDETQAQAIYEDFGGSITNVRDRLSSLVVERTKSALSRYTAQELIDNRDLLSSEVEQMLMNTVTERGLPIVVRNIYVTNIQFSDAYNDAVEAKMIAEQDRLKAETEKAIAIIQAEQVLATTKLEAEAKLEEARGEANALLAIAQAEATALSAKIIEVSRSLGFDIIETDVLGEDDEGNPIVVGTEYTIDMVGHTQDELDVVFNYIEYIQYLQTWDGKLPEVVAGDNAVSLLIPTE